MTRAYVVGVAALCVLVLGSAQLQAAEPTSGEVTTRVREVGLFKNGLGYFVRTGQLPERAGDFVIRPLPAPAHGTFWVSYQAGVALNGLTARRAMRTEMQPVTDLVEVLAANPRKRVRLYGGWGDPVEGTMVDLVEREPPPAADPYASGRPSALSSVYVRRTQATQLVLVKTDEGVVALNPAQLQRVDVLADKVSSSLEKQVEAMELAGRTLEVGGDRNFVISYLAKGITWAPSYKIDISDTETAAISIKATIINEIEDLEDVTFHLVTGVPHVQFADVPSPLSLKMNLAQFFQYLRRPPDQRARVEQQDILSQRVRFPGGEGGPVLPAYAAGAVGQAAEDLFLYPLEQVKLRKGEVGYYPILSGSVPYKHIYQWDIPDYVNEEDRYGRRSAQSPDDSHVVWHSLRLQNTTALPWTTAPAMTVAKGQIIGQDTLTYTPVGGSVTLKLTQAVAVAADERELEVDRVRNARQLYGWSYDEVTIEGALRVKNFKAEPVALEITKTFSGELISSTPEGKVLQLARGLKTVNPTNLLTWQLPVGRGEEIELHYRYKVLVRR